MERRNHEHTEKKLLNSLNVVLCGSSLGPCTTEQPKVGKQGLDGKYIERDGVRTADESRMQEL